jgi:hypothetical protein
MNDIAVPPLLPTTRPRRPRRWLRVLLALLIFLAGLTFGGAATAVYVAYRFQYALRHPDELPTRLAARLTRRLKLSATQESQIRDILTQRQANLRTIRTQFQPQVFTQLEGVHTDIGNILTPPQREKWNFLYDDLIRNWMPPMPEPPAPN